MKRLVVVGGSAGGVDALRDVVAGLPVTLDAAVCVVLHLAPSSPSVLAGILARSTSLPCAAARDGEPLAAGRIYVGPPNHHLRVVDGHVELSTGPQENGHRPAIDQLFTSAARAHGEQVVGVVVSGMLDDGAAGLAAVAARGGRAVVQDPEDALFADMPINARRRVPSAHVAPARAIGALVARITDEEDPDPMPDDTPPDLQPAAIRPDPDGALSANEAQPENGASGLSCPDCGGSLWEVREAGSLRFRCRIGHAYGDESLLAEHDRSVETALWTALRALEERASLLLRLARRAADAGSERTAASFRSQSAHAEEQAAIIRDRVVPTAVATRGAEAA